ncbi:IQ motif and SEC7 domain-containing protein 1 isoform X2 [Fopius arisanus]|uniref:IQ motif and SEC7 domain-containing protein 1 isoform X2 n=1 Tax=Fopius arisanus TaxID=64838 RepID=A0A0C9QHF3_9HYME|nr:PREDICTED: IQ motif and SEC7 domain-containing protein 1 isoform X2 [Fopius arisanus]XP_011302706.1 PREDICTED: IQ motif and SEC7 domain-containing protein 1 isoform X2 [Fopius arisanus]XP_011302708.1 PREDICTED: IQ motif and SEC7 domain-containing protein 1 isoform X2 [Fopius arisanus]XP_011302709.1 PREDICTED: IQ motif and SEC7 domain-containing protein 1 isoform X2 [Fopius arisanus]XP_011302710.1 PREDICTED: IQ motif and SEC7 domain-containing protein 1 isoform X2 [Fopius arisanus]XP_0113027
MFGVTMVEPRERLVACTTSQMQHQNNNCHRHHYHHVVKTTRIHQSSRSNRVVTVQEKVIRSRLQLGYSTPTSFINRFPQKMDRPNHNVSLGQNHGGSTHGVYSSGSQTSLSTSYITGQSYIQGQNYAAYPAAQTVQIYPHTYNPPQSYGTMVQAYGGQPQSGYQQGHHKKGTMRNGDVHKRCRLQTASYELSQDLLDKQIEMLERKYGGVKARNAALTIQRAFRRYTLLKKFAAITAMAKAEKRLSRTIQESADRPSDHDRIVYHNQVYIQQSPQSANRPMPIRSMSLRERRHVENSGMPRSLSGRCEVQVMAHQVNTGHHHPGYNIHQSGRHTPSLTPSPCARHQPPPSPCWDTSSQESGSSIHYYNPQETLCGLRQETPPRDLHRTPCTSPSTPHNLQAPLTHSWGNSSQLGSGGRSRGSAKKVPPEVPKRTTSITSRSMEQRHNGLSKSVENGSLSSVQSSGSDSTNCESSEGDVQRGSPIWKHKAISSSPEHQECHTTENTTLINSGKDLSNSHAGSGYQLPMIDHTEAIPQTSYKVSETVRKRQYRVGLNLFNKKPERGITYLIRRGFLENSPQGVARFLISRKGLSKQMIGEYLGNLQNTFNMAVLECFSHELDLAGMQVDVALRKFQAYFRMPGEAQKIERLMEVFSQRYCHCNPDVVARLRSPDTVFVLAFAIIMLNTDLHTPNLKPERRMRVEDFIKNLRGIDDCGDIDRDILIGIYERVKANEFKPGSDHVTQVMKVQATIVGKKPNMALPHRRLVCYCRLYEIPDIHKKERPGVHQREVFLFNDLLVVTKILSKKKSSVTYTFRQSFPLCGMVVTLFDVPHYPYGIRLSQRVDGKVLVTFNARNEHDRCKFAEDLRESISEMDEMETLRIETELERQKSSRGARGGSENRDSGVADVEVCPCPGPCSERTEVADLDPQLKRSALSNSLLDIHEQFAGEKPQRRGSVGSLDSGMSISFQSTSASSMSQGVKHSGQVHPVHPGATIPGGGKGIVQQPSFLGGLFAKRERKLSQTEESSPYSRTTEV